MEQVSSETHNPARANREGERDKHWNHKDRENRRNTRKKQKNLEPWPRPGQLYFSILPRIKKRYFGFLVSYSAISSAVFPLQFVHYNANCMKYLVTVRLSVSPDVMLAHCMLKIYVPGGIRAEGLPYHADDGSFVLGCHPRRQDERGQNGGSQESKICCTAQRTSVWWSWAE